MVFKKDLIKFFVYTIREDIKNLKWAITIKMYKIFTQIHLNYKFKKITFKNIQIHGLFDCLAKRVKILDGMKCSPLFAPIPLNSIQFIFTMYNGLKCLPVKINYSNLCKFGLAHERFNV